MIAKLKGRIDATGADWLVIDVNGVGYHVSCSTKTLSALAGPGEFAELHTEMLVSQDMIRLVGFATPSERDWFQLLDNVQGVGTRVALAILSTLTASELANAIAWGPGPRASQAFMLACRARAIIQGRLAPSVDDVVALAGPILRHRMAVNFSARAEGVTVESVISQMCARLG